MSWHLCSWIPLRSMLPFQVSHLALRVEIEAADGGNVGIVLSLPPHQPFSAFLPPPAALRWDFSKQESCYVWALWPSKVSCDSVSDPPRAAVRAHEVSRHLAVAFSGFGSEFSCPLVLTSLPWSGANSTVTTLKEPRWSDYEILEKYYWRVLLFPSREEIHLLHLLKCFSHPLNVLKGIRGFWVCELCTSEANTKTLTEILGSDRRNIVLYCR